MAGGAKLVRVGLKPGTWGCAVMAGVEVACAVLDGIADTRRRDVGAGVWCCCLMILNPGRPIRGREGWPQAGVLDGYP
jgi:hypothetical protein